MATEQVAWIGLGNMGRGMCKNIAAKGPQTTPLILYNRTTARATSLAATLGGPGKAIVAESIPDAVSRSSLIFICVGDDAALTEIISAMLTNNDSSSLAGKTIVDCSTVHPDTTRRVSAQVSDRGAQFVACPVFGAPAFADAGQLVAIPAGPVEAVERVKPFLKGVTARAVIDMSSSSSSSSSGETEKDKDVHVDVGRASLLKILGNTFILNTVETLAEGLVLAEKTGLGTPVFQEWMETMFPGAFAKYCDRMTSGDYFVRQEPLFAVDLARKDLAHAMDLARSGGMRLRSSEVMDRYLVGVKEEKGEKGDVAAVYGAVRKESGLSFGNQ